MIYSCSFWNQPQVVFGGNATSKRLGLCENLRTENEDLINVLNLFYYYLQFWYFNFESPLGF